MIGDLKPSEALTVLAERVSREGAWHCGETMATNAGCVLWHLTKIYGLKFHNWRIPYWDLVTLDATKYLASVIQPEWPECTGFAMPTEVVFKFNDSHTQTECVDLCHRAARLAKEAGQ